MIKRMIKAHPTKNRMARRAKRVVDPRYVLYRYAGRMTVRDMLTALQTFPRDAELLAFEAG
jgi:hypothetical protein